LFVALLIFQLCPLLCLYFPLPCKARDKVEILAKGNISKKQG